MNEPFDALEAELKALQPQAVSPGMAQRIGDRLQTELETRRPDRRGTWAAGLAMAGALAACVVLAVALWRGREPPDVESMIELSPGVAAAFDPAVPSVWAYSRALRHSAEEAEALLEKHAAIGPARGEPAAADLMVHARGKLLLQGEL